MYFYIYSWELIRNILGLSRVSWRKFYIIIRAYRKFWRRDIVSYCTLLIFSKLLIIVIIRNIVTNTLIECFWLSSFLSSSYSVSLWDHRITIKFRRSICLYRKIQIRDIVSHCTLLIFSKLLIIVIIRNIVTNTLIECFWLSSFLSSSYSVSLWDGRITIKFRRSICLYRKIQIL